VCCRSRERDSDEQAHGFSNWLSMFRPGMTGAF
jgi:hypothetical protein